MTPSLGIEPRLHWWETRALTTAPYLHPMNKRELSEPWLSPMPSKALLEQPKHDFFRFWIKTSFVCGIKPPHHLRSKIQVELAVKKSVVYGIGFTAIQAVTFTFNSISDILFNSFLVTTIWWRSLKLNSLTCSLVSWHVLYDILKDSPYEVLSVRSVLLQRCKPAGVDWCSLKFKSWWKSQDFNFSKFNFLFSSNVKDEAPWTKPSTAM